MIGGSSIDWSRGARGGVGGGGLEQGHLVLCSRQVPQGDGVAVPGHSGLDWDGPKVISACLTYHWINAAKVLISCKAVLSRLRKSKTSSPILGTLRDPHMAPLASSPPHGRRAHGMNRGGGDGYLSVE